MKKSLTSKSWVTFGYLRLPSVTINQSYLGSSVLFLPLHKNSVGSSLHLHSLREGRPPVGGEEDHQNLERLEKGQKRCVCCLLPCLTSTIHKVYSWVVDVMTGKIRRQDTPPLASLHSASLDSPLVAVRRQAVGTWRPSSPNWICLIIEDHFLIDKECSRNDPRLQVQILGDEKDVYKFPPPNGGTEGQAQLKSGEGNAAPVFYYRIWDFSIYM